MSSKVASRYLQHLQARKHQQQRRTRAGLITTATRPGYASSPSRNTSASPTFPPRYLPTVREPDPSSPNKETSETWSSGTSTASEGENPSYCYQSDPYGCTDEPTHASTASRTPNYNDSSIATRSEQLVVAHYDDVLDHGLEEEDELHQQQQFRQHPFYEETQTTSFAPALRTASHPQPHHRSRPSQDSYGLSQSPCDDDSFLQMIDETAERWSHSGAISDALVSQQTPEEIIQEQRKEIERLQALLNGGGDNNNHNLNSPHYPLEAIDDGYRNMSPNPVAQVPFEQIEVDTDHLSITSGLTHLHLDSTFDQFDEPAHIQRPDAASVTAGEQHNQNHLLHSDDYLGAPPTSRGRHLRQSSSSSQHHFSKPPLPQHRRTLSEAQGLPVNLIASDGSVRKASYTGTTRNNLPHGKGTLVLENGDEYTGEMARGEMHGRGTYTFQHKRKHTEKVLSGYFEHNIFVG